MELLANMYSCDKPKLFCPFMKYKKTTSHWYLSIDKALVKALQVF